MRVDKYIVDLPEPKSTTKVSVLRGLRKDQSIFIPNAELTKSTRKGMYGMATLAGIEITTRKVDGGLRVWRTDGEPQAEIVEDVETAELPIPKSEKLDNLRTLMDLSSSGVKASEIYGDPVETTATIDPPEIDEWDGWSEERTTRDEVADEAIYYREHIKTRKRKEIRRETYYG